MITKDGAKRSSSRSSVLLFGNPLARRGIPTSSRSLAMIAARRSSSSNSRAKVASSYDHSILVGNENIFVVTSAYLDIEIHSVGTHSRPPRARAVVTRINETMATQAVRWPSGRSRYRGPGQRRSGASHPYRYRARSTIGLFEHPWLPVCLADISATSAWA